MKQSLVTPDARLVKWYDAAAMERTAPRDNMAAFERVVCENGDRLYRAACLLLSDPTEAEDLTQAVFVQAWRGWAKFESRSQPYTWLYRILLRTCRRQQRRRWWFAGWLSADDSSYQDEIESIADNRSSPDALARQQDDWSEVRAVIRTMSPKLREALVLRYTEDWTLAQIAETIGIPEGTLKSRLHLAEKTLAERLKARGWK